MENRDKSTNKNNNGDKDIAEKECNLRSNLVPQLCLIGIQVFYFFEFSFLFR